MSTWAQLDCAQYRVLSLVTSGTYDCQVTDKNNNNNCELYFFLHIYLDTCPISLVCGTKLGSIDSSSLAGLTLYLARSCSGFFIRPVVSSIRVAIINSRERFFSQNFWIDLTWPTFSNGHRATVPRPKRQQTETQSVCFLRQYWITLSKIQSRIINREPLRPIIDSYAPIFLLFNSILIRWRGKKTLTGLAWISTTGRSSLSWNNNRVWERFQRKI